MYNPGSTIKSKEALELRECFCWIKHEDGEEALTTVQKHSREAYNLAALLFFFLFLDNLLRRVEGQGWKGFWPRSGRFEEHA
jgi:hypothetical protein